MPVIAKRTIAQSERRATSAQLAVNLPSAHIAKSAKEVRKHANGVIRVAHAERVANAPIAIVTEYVAFVEDAKGAKVPTRAGTAKRGMLVGAKR